MGKKLDKFLLLMWKNWKLQYRRPLQTTLEILAPVLFSLLLVVLRSLVEPKQHPTHEYVAFHPIPTYFFATDVNRKLKEESNFTAFLETYMIIYSPSPNLVLDTAMSYLKPSFRNIKGYRNAKQLEHHFTTVEGEFTLAAIQFKDELYNKTTIPRDIEVSIRFHSELRNLNERFFLSPQTPDNITMFHDTNNSESVLETLNRLFHIRDWKTNVLYPTFDTPGPRNPERSTGAIPNYFSEGYLALQAVVTYLLIIVQINPNMFIRAIFEKDFLFPIIRMKRFPFHTWKDDVLLPALISFIGIVIMLSFVYTCINTVKVITNEKEKQLKEAMKIMGLPNWLHWSAWFAKSLAFLLVSIIGIVFLLTIAWYPHTNYSLFTYANPLILFLFLLFYIIATITFCFSVSVFFSKANTAATVAGLLWFLSYAPYLFLQSQYDQLSLSTKLLVCLGSNTAMAYGLQMFLMYESTSEGIQWSNIWKPNTPDDSLTLGLVIVMLAVDAFIYLCITLYVEAVFPGEYGTPQPWYFPVSYSYWCGSPRKVLLENNFFNNFTPNSDFFEKNPLNLNLAVQIQNLRKMFGKKVAINNLCLNIYDDQITVLLGHNGAGKTTTISILTGIIPPTNGKASIRGFDIRTNMKDIRANLGLCPQHNILFDELTVREHLYFFSKLKGLHKREIQEEINKYVKLLDLEAKIDKKSHTLSGGMKRKLCVGIALCGGSKVVLLDEPTAGMDPSSRRALWDLLQTQKTGRCILLTTHYMDEADLLGDRIAIMANGDLKCCGSSFFLKKKFGTGYHLILDKLPKCDSQKVTEMLKNYISDIQIHRTAGSELVYLLQQNNSPSFPEMLKTLEKSKNDLGIRSYGISLTTLEDVFIKVGTDIESRTSNVINVNQPDKTKPKMDNTDYVVEVKPKKITLLTGSELIRNQFIAMFLKKIVSISRTWLLQIIQIVIPVAFLIVAISVSRNVQKHQTSDLPSLPITLDSYRDPIVVIQDDLNNSFSNFYREILKNYDVKDVTNMTTSMLNLTKTIPSVVKKRFLVGGSFTTAESSSVVLTAWFNNNPYHTPPLALGLMLNAIYKTMLGTNYSITFVNHPLPFKTDTKIQRLMKGQSMGFQIAFNLGFSMAFVSSFYILFNVRERVCKSKHLQFASGVKSYVFWTTSFTCDLMTFVVTILAILVTLICFQEEGFRKPSELGRMFFILFYFGWAMLPMVYFGSYLFEIPSTGYTRMTLFSVLTGVTAFLVVQILSTPGLSLKHIADALHWIFLLIPHYTLSTGIRDTYYTYSATKICNFFVSHCLQEHSNLTTDACWFLACNGDSAEILKRDCCEREPNYFKWESPGVGKNILYSFITGVTLFLLLNLLEYKIFAKMFRGVFSSFNKVRTLPFITDEDDDVIEEKTKIRNTPQTQLLKDYSLVLKDVTKFYRDFLAVNRICLGVQQFECFGLLGVNGAGKTSTFKMITGDRSITYGNAWIHGFSINSDLNNVQKLIGYCPQFDALLTDLTAKETLIMFALLRGVPLNECKYIAKKLAQDFDFYQHLNKKIKQLSGGNKRKLSAAVSLIGDPPVICLDEPTAGMDPVTKRNLWNALCTVRDSGKCILFTSHSMEECEALCTRLAIMVNGNFKCIGPLQHLKNKFAAGYTLTIKIKRKTEDVECSEEYENVENFMGQSFPTAKLQEKHQELITYYIADEKISLSNVFEELENAKNRLNIEDYSLGQSNLEQIFLRMTQLQQ